MGIIVSSSLIISEVLCSVFVCSQGSVVVVVLTGTESFSVLESSFSLSCRHTESSGFTAAPNTGRNVLLEPLSITECPLRTFIYYRTSS